MADSGMGITGDSCFHSNVCNADEISDWNKTVSLCNRRLDYCPMGDAGGYAGISGNQFSDDIHGAGGILLGGKECEKIWLYPK